MLNDLAEFIEIESVLGEPEENAPFGRENARALALFLEKAAAYGLKTGSDGGYAGWAEYGEGETLIGVLAHLDVVPAGGGWSYDPFRLTVKDGNMYGRGVSDDKGPLVACLHALARLRRENADLGCRVRLIAGCNEETGSECIKHYVRHCEIPKASFTPDADFPVVASEKGIAHLKITFPRSEALAEGKITAQAGTRPNVVPNAATLLIGRGSPLFDAPAAEFRDVGGLPHAERIAGVLKDYGCDPADFACEMTDDGLRVTARGVAAHGSTPEKGDNAAAKILFMLLALTGDESVAAACEYLAPRDAAERLGIAAEDATGALTMNLGVLSAVGGVLSLTVDIRTPACSDYADIKRRLAEALTGAEITELHRSEPLAFDENDTLVSTLLGVYRKVTGDTASRPLHIGGGTYAKELPNCVGFGAVFPGTDTRMHEPDEFYPVAAFETLETIYYEAIKALCAAYR